MSLRSSRRSIATRSTRCSRARRSKRSIVDPNDIAIASALDPLRLPLVTLGAQVREAAFRAPALGALRLQLAAPVLNGGAALDIAPLDALTIITATLDAHGLTFGGASALDLTLATTALSLGKTALAATATFDALRPGLTPSAALGLDLTASAATLRLGLPATGALDLSLAFSVAAPVGLGRCRRSDRKCRDTGR